MDAAATATHASGTTRDAARSSPASRSPAAHAVGGVMVGAAAAALVQVLLPHGALQPLVLLLLATVAILSAWKLGAGADVADAAGLAAALAVPFHDAPAVLGLVVAGLALFVTLAQRGRSPLALLAASTFFVGMRHAVGVDLMLGESAMPAATLLLSLVAYGAFVAATSPAGTSWTGPALALVGVAVVLSAFPLLDAAGVTDPGLAALILGALVGALLLAGVALRARALVATMGALLPLAALAFALLALGPALAAVVLLALGGAVLWHAERLRASFKWQERAS